MEYRRLLDNVDDRDERDWHSCMGKQHGAAVQPLAMWERGGAYLCDECYQHVEKERNLIQDAERIQEITNDRIPFDRACWIALYIQRITSGMTHEQAIAAEEDELTKRGVSKALIAEMEQPSVIDMLAAHAPEATRPVSPYPSFERFAQAHGDLDRVC